MAVARKYDHDAVLNLRAQGTKPSEIARRFNMSLEAVRYILVAAIRRGDDRATPPAAPIAIHRPEPVREGVMVIRVATTGRDYGLPKMVPVSLPRLSILEGWTGAS